MSEAFILCDGLVKIYQVADLEMVALRELNLTIDKGELIAIVGSSGSGKTTLMNILGGLDRPSAGRVRVDGLDLLKLSDRQLNKYRREKVGFVWQQSARNLIPYLNAIDNVMLPMTLAGVTGRVKRQRAEQLLDLVGLKQRMRHGLPELSGGEQQRVAIAVGLANNPSLLLADEPTGEVDSTTAGQIYDTFRILTGEMGVTTVIVSHDPAIAQQVGRVVSIRDGMLASETIRQTSVEGTNGALGEDGQAAHPDRFEELVVIDRAGRLHIPQDYLDQFAIRGRAQLELTPEGILIRSTGQDRVEVEIAQKTSANSITAPQVTHVQNLLGRFRLRRKNP
jgi:ABC-type lipoprotein export system ATPase subunit